MIAIRQLDRIAPAPQPTEGMSREWDSAFAETYMAAGRELGLYYELVTHEDWYLHYGTDGHAVAVVMSAAEAEALIVRDNIMGRKNMEEANRHLSPMDIMSDVTARYEPRDYLAWNTLIEHPACVAGKTRQEALLLATEAWLRHHYDVGMPASRFERYGKTALLDTLAL